MSWKDKYKNSPEGSFGNRVYQASIHVQNCDEEQAMELAYIAGKLDCHILHALWYTWGCKGKCPCPECVERRRNHYWNFMRRRRG